MEYLDIVDENNELTGQVEERKLAHEKHLFHRHVSTWIMNQKGEILLQKRSAKVYLELLDIRHTIAELSLLDTIYSKKYKEELRYLR